MARIEFNPSEELTMKPNVGNTDRIIRIVAGIILLGAIFVIEGNLRWLGLIGVVPLATGLFRWCPAYELLGLDTCGAARKSG